VATAAHRRDALETQVADLGAVDLPSCDLANASLSLPFLPPDAFWAMWQRILAALPTGSRFAAMVLGGRSEEPGIGDLFAQRARYTRFLLDLRRELHLPI